MNFVETILSNGFERIVPDFEKKKGRVDAGFNPKNGWMGLLTYHPYERFIKENKTVELSLERFGVDSMLFDENGVVSKTKINEKHITVSIDKNVVYHNKFGLLPPPEIIEKIIN